MHDAAVWRAGGLVDDYDHRVLEPAETLLLVRYREAFSGRVLDVGCGPGRVLGYLLQLGSDARGIDISPEMVAVCRARYPTANVAVGDLSHLSEAVSGKFDVILMTSNLIDVFEDDERRAVLGRLRELIAPGGLLMFSSHNLAGWERSEAGGAGARERLLALAGRSPLWWLQAVARLPRRRANRRRLGAQQKRAGDYAILNDSAHDYGLLHYYIGAPAQARQLDDVGYEMVEVSELDGDAVPAGTEGQGSSLYYVARPR